MRVKYCQQLAAYSNHPTVTFKKDVFETEADGNKGKFKEYEIYDFIFLKG